MNRFWACIPSSDLNRYMNIQQAINMTIFERFEQEGIEFAFHTQTVLVNSGANGQAKESVGFKGSK